MDELDRKILRLLQHDASVGLEKIANAVNLSRTPCWNRIRRMEERGIIERRTAMVVPEMVGLGLTVFVALRTNRHDEEWLEQLATTTRDMPEILEVYRLAGEIDYLLKVVIEDTTAYDAFYRRLIGKLPLSNVSSMISMERIKSTNCLPI